MSYVALVTNRFDEVTRFYGELLGFPVLDQWDRSNARGRRFDTGGMRLEIIDNQREKNPRELGEPAGEQVTDAIRHLEIEILVQAQVAHGGAVQQQSARCRTHLAELFFVEAQIAEIFVEVPLNAAMLGPRVANQWLVAQGRRG